jgi:hypothetical protein
MMQMQNYGYGPPPSMRQETPIFNVGGVQVTTARFICWQQTYPIGGITSVSPFTVFASKSGPNGWGVWSALWGVIWFVGLLNGAGANAVIGFIFSALCVAACVAWARSKKDSYGVMITTAGMNVRAVVSADREFVGNIIGALNYALSMR